MRFYHVFLIFSPKFVSCVVVFQIKNQQFSNGFSLQNFRTKAVDPDPVHLDNSRWFWMYGKVLQKAYSVRRRCRSLIYDTKTVCVTLIYRSFFRKAGTNHYCWWMFNHIGIRQGPDPSFLAIICHLSHRS